MRFLMNFYIIWWASMGPWDHTGMLPLDPRMNVSCRPLGSLDPQAQGTMLKNQYTINDFHYFFITKSSLKWL